MRQIDLDIKFSTKYCLVIEGQFIKGERWRNRTFNTNLESRFSADKSCMMFSEERRKICNYMMRFSIKTESSISDDDSGNSHF